jgi:hypothetical protein
VMDPRAAKLLLDSVLFVQYRLEYIMMPTYIWNILVKTATMTFFNTNHYRYNNSRIGIKMGMVGGRLFK